MEPTTAILAFSLAAGLLTITPGLDTALVLRTATVEGGREAMAAGAGVVAGVLAWGLFASLGLGAVLAVSELGYRVLQYAGAAYLVWLGAKLLLAGLRGAGEALEGAGLEASRGRSTGWFWRGLMTNLLNPKVGVFYVSLLPQFIPVGVPIVGFSIGLAAIHAAMGLTWFAILTAATRPFATLLRRPGFVRGVDGLTGSVLVAFGVRLALDRQT
ncbi:LysE family translocator [Amorphus sp. 3PC139-8]|uniref:LysE family translocator n=1 Tax=Amorphus sp. 3PC139-8 TaxID=2735676 RepID=UPI00345DA20B